MLTVANLGCSRGERLLFSGLGICLPPGTKLAVQGPNGCGKTSFLKLLAGILPMRDGEIRWKDTRNTDHPDYLNEMIYLGHKNGLKSTLTVYQNLHFWASQRGEVMLLEPAVRFFDLAPFLDMPVGQLSAGWQRRVALAKLLLAPCKLWLLDEPASHLDEEGAQKLSGLIESRILSGGIVVMASHGKEEGCSILNMKDFAADV